MDAARETTASDDEATTATYGGDSGGGFKSGAGNSPNGRPRREGFETFLELQEVLATMTVDAKRALGYERDDFILDCEYSGAFCYAR